MTITISDGVQFVGGVSSLNSPTLSMNDEVIEIKDEEEDEEEEKIPEKPVPAVVLEGEGEESGEYDDALVSELLMCWSFVQRVAATVGLKPMNFESFLREFCVKESCSCLSVCVCVWK